LCIEHIGIPGLTFKSGAAEALPFDDESFDVVINIESSHCYQSIAKFLSSVHRVLRPNGYFAFAEFRSAGDAAKASGAVDLVPN
jgi:ubiquinone/menaquinone biosynthesis C-methylase UbiE